MREHYLGAYDKPVKGSAWEKVIEDVQIKHQAKFEQGIFCEFGFAEEVIAMLDFSCNGDQEEYFYVGIGESLRPFVEVYSGNSREEASAAFTRAVCKHTRCQ